jgi:hypothetical protein
MMFFPHKEDTLKVLCQYLYYKYVRNGWLRRQVVGGHGWFLTRVLEERVILDILESVVLISLLKVR